MHYFSEKSRKFNRFLQIEKSNFCCLEFKSNYSIKDAFECVNKMNGKVAMDYSATGFE